MAQKRQVRKTIKNIQRVKTWQLLILLILVALLGATFLRLNNIGMIERRTAVLQADKTGDKRALENNLYALQRWSVEHMNASSDVFYLEETYNRDVKKAIDKAKKASENNGITQQIANKADKACRQQATQYGVYSTQYVQCFVNEQRKHGSMADVESEADIPKPDLYRHEFISPLWSPDFAGWSLVVGLIIIFVIVLRFISLLILKALLRRHYSSI